MGERSGAGALLLAAALWSAAPLVIHLGGSEERNPFLTASVVKGVSVALLCVALTLTRHRKNAALRRLSTASGVHLSSVTRGANLFRQIPGTAGAQATMGAPLTWARLPVVQMACCGCCDIALFVFATRFVETAVAAIAVEMFPVLLVVMLARRARREASTSAVRVSRPTTGRWVPVVLTATAALGVVLVLSSQATDLSSVSDLLNFNGVAGLGLGLLTALAFATSVLASIRFGDTVLGRLGGTSRRATAPQPAIEVRPVARWHDGTVLLFVWYSVLGLVAAWSVAAAVNLLLGLLTAPHLGGLPLPAAGWAVVLGVLSFTNVTLLRIGNARPVSSTVNLVLFCAPVLALLWLLLAGLTVPHFHLFLVGAGLVLGSNVLLRQATRTPSLAPSID